MTVVCGSCGLKWDTDVWNICPNCQAPPPVSATLESTEDNYVSVSINGSPENVLALLKGLLR